MGSLSKIYPNSAGIDIGSEKVFISVEDQPVRYFRTFTASYRELGAYLKEHSITHVAMEATGIYWVTLYDVLEEAGFDVSLFHEPTLAGSAFANPWGQRNGYHKGDTEWGKGCSNFVKLLHIRPYKTKRG
jgi:hypothetical protein